MKMTCLIRVLATPHFAGMGLFSSSGRGDAVKPLLAKTREVYEASWLLVGTGMMFTVPIVADFGEPKLNGAALLFGPAPRPRAFETYKVWPSALTFIAAGHQPTGI